MRIGSLASDDVNSAAEPSKSPCSPAGNPSAATASRTAFTAWPSDAPGATLNDSVTAGNCPCRVMASGAVTGSACVIVLSGTTTGWPALLPRT